MNIDEKTRYGKTCGGKGGKYFFAGGGTGGHIYPALAVAERIQERIPDSEIVFFCSSRPIDSHILSKAGFEFIPLGAVGFSARPDRFIRFVALLIRSYYFARQILKANSHNAAVVGTGGFVSVPVVLAARHLGIPVALVNTDAVPGKANKLLASVADNIFVQFERTVEYFGRHTGKVIVCGCPLRSCFSHPDRGRAMRSLGLDEGKNTVLVTGASSGSLSINNAIIAILPQLKEFAGTWQIAHLTGRAKLCAVTDCPVDYKAVDYYDDMADLYAAADIVIGRAGAISVAEYAAAGVPAICMPYPYHGDRHQYLNAAALVHAGAAVIVDDVVGEPAATAAGLLVQLTDLMRDKPARLRMAQAAKSVADVTAAERIASKLIEMQSPLQQ